MQERSQVYMNDYLILMSFISISYTILKWSGIFKLLKPQNSLG